MPPRQGATGSNSSWVQGREWLLAVAPVVAIGLVALAVSLWFWEPGPPRTVFITTGGESGAYYAFGKRYAEIVGRSGVRLEVKPSAGSIENLARLQDASSGVSIGLLQGGIGNSDTAPGLRSVGRVFQEPLWVFYRGENLETLGQLKGKRIAIGPEGSGNRVLAGALLEANQITAATARLSPLTAQPAVDAMRAGEIDAVFLALAPQAPLIQALLRSGDVKLMSFAQADAYTKLFPYLAKLALPRGVIDLVADIPAHDMVLLAPTAALIVREDLHPAIVALLAEAAQEVHGKVSLFSKAGEFPTSHDPDFEMDPDAVRFYKSGPTFWKRILPFWVANMVERLLVFAVPLLTVLVPLSRAAPAIYRWRIRQRLLLRYRQLKDIEARIADLPKGASMVSLVGELDELDGAITNMPIPLPFSEQYYDLRGHLQDVRQRIMARETV